ncbi:hypothetical protein CDAR_458251 [Caerostris darwini]|uniref:Uncharacterized protein n=1 Tax=Caerostris darwini TaxID=1538125 RepID=A0AAV4TTA5_9ARAC|nr:hypothetical protein CDAR_458251 [Caerostris darwini]
MRMYFLRALTSETLQHNAERKYHVPFYRNDHSLLIPNDLIVWVVPPRLCKQIDDKSECAVAYLFAFVSEAIMATSTCYRFTSIPTMKANPSPMSSAAAAASNCFGKGFVAPREGISSYC